MHKIVKVLIGILVALSVSTCVDAVMQTAAASTITVPNDHLIVPGVRMGPFVLGMTETQLLAMGQPSNRVASTLVDNSYTPAHLIPVTVYCYWDQVVCVEVNQTNHLVQAVYTEGTYTNGSCPFRTSSGLTCGSSAAHVSQAFELGEPDNSESVYHPYLGQSSLNGRLMELGFRNVGAGTVTHIFFVDAGASMASPVYTNVRGISITYYKYVAEWY
ncbi:MAG: hypothetical protein M0037_05690 [Betaproteobacteria bacterium]|nr:hypothetical protein [Betaproteobacteria bacterium]